MVAEHHITTLTTVRHIRMVAEHHITTLIIVRPTATVDPRITILTIVRPTATAVRRIIILTTARLIAAAAVSKTPKTILFYSQFATVIIFY